MSPTVTYLILTVVVIIVSGLVAAMIESLL